MIKKTILRSKGDRRTGRRWARKTFRMKTVADLPDRTSIGRLATALGVAMATVQHWINIGLRSQKQQNRRMIRKADLIAFLQATKRLKGGSRETTQATL